MNLNILVSDTCTCVRTCTYTCMPVNYTHKTCKSKIARKSCKQHMNYATPTLSHHLSDDAQTPNTAYVQ